VLLIDRSTCIGSGAGALMCPAGSALRSDRAEVRAEVKCDLMKRSHILLS
jgi:Fe-S-cluster-containing hydrogenase component 2